MKLPTTIDCTIIGGGIVGVATAYELARAGIRSLVLESGAIGSGVSGASLAALAAHALARVEDLPVITAAGRRWAELEAEIGDSFEYRRQGQLRLINDVDDIDRFAALVAEHQALGAPLELLDQATLRTLVPTLGPTAAMAAAYSPDDASVNALRAVNALSIAAARAGAIIASGCHVTDLTSTGSGGVIVSTGAGKISSDWVVLATGPWTNAVLEPLGVNLPLEARRARCAVTEPLPALLAPIISGVETGAGLGIGEGYFQIQQTQSGHLLFNTVVDSALDDTTELHHQSVDESFMVASSRTLARLLPATGTARFLRSWAAVEAWTPDRRFLCGPLESHPQVIIAAGDSGSGFLRAPLLGGLVRDALLGRAPGPEVAMFAPDRFASAC